MRSVANHGVRVLPYRFHSKHDIKEKDERWFSSGRWASAYYDASPAVAKKMEVGRCRAAPYLPPGTAVCVCVWRERCGAFLCVFGLSVDMVITQVEFVTPVIEQNVLLRLCCFS